MNLIAGIDVTAGALNAQKTRLDIVAQNIANAQTTRTPEGGPYQRQVVSFETELVRREGGASLQSVKVGGINSNTTGRYFILPRNRAIAVARIRRWSKLMPVPSALVRAVLVRPSRALSWTNPAS